MRVHGKLFRESLHTTDRKISERKLRDFRNSKEKIDAKLGKMTVESLCDRYEQTLTQLSPSSIKNKRGILCRIKSDWPQGKEQAVSAIKSSDCETWLARQAARVGRSHLNAYLQVLRALLQFAVRDHLIAENPAAHMRYRKREVPIRATPTWEEFRAIVTDIRKQVFNPDAYASADFVEFIGLSGLGQAEASALTWADIDFVHGQIITFRKKTGSGFTVPIFPQLQTLLERLRGQSRAASDDRVFAIRQARKAIAAACGRLGYPKYTHRSLRRMFITRAIEKGVDVKVIAQWQGHKDGGKLILDTYSHVNPVHSQRMAQLMVDSASDPCLAHHEENS